LANTARHNGSLPNHYGVVNCFAHTSSQRAASLHACKTPRSEGRGRRSGNVCAWAQGPRGGQAISGARRPRVAALPAPGARLVQPAGVQLDVFRSCEGVAQFPDKGDHLEPYGESDPARDDDVFHPPCLRADRWTCPRCGVTDSSTPAVNTPRSWCADPARD